ncbi:pantoate--beta-alanine ligase [Micrococcales bacterium 31B]|nr:pantoate--beta-alanine ligase [Micrococcales bacterium 31B]
MTELTTPVVLHTLTEVNTWRAAAQGSVGVVMTMGALHEGHVSLVRQARERTERVLVTIFVNPLQFGPHEDYDRYPRTLDADLTAVAGLADAVFAPSAADMYPGGASETLVRAGRIGANFEGRLRPGHFDGMLTVVLKLLHVTQPDAAWFGRKDAQQLALIRRMVLDFNVPVDVVGAPIVRDAEGMALSSRNRYLSPAERVAGLRLSRSVRAAQRAATRSRSGYVVDANFIRGVAWGELEAPGLDVPFEIDYAELVNPDTFEVINAAYQGEALYVVAVRVGSTRLLDNGTLVMGARAGDTLNG